MSSSNLIGSNSGGFTLVELLVAMVLSLIIAMALSGLWLSIQRNQVEAADRVYAHLTTRVVASRFEKDLRHATVEGAGNDLTSSLLRADPREVVVLTVSQGGLPQLVEWEVTGGNLMRRHGPWTGSVPLRSQHLLYTSSKTMLEGLGSSAGFTYTRGGVATSSVSDVELERVTRVALNGQVVIPKVSVVAVSEIGS